MDEKASANAITPIKKMIRKTTMSYMQAMIILISQLKVSNVRR